MILRSILLLVSFAVLSHCILPSSIDPVAVVTYGQKPPKSRIFRVVASPVPTLELHNPEAVAIDRNGRLHSSDDLGNIVRISSYDGGTSVEHFASAGGYPIGMAAAAHGGLWIANYPLGLQEASETGAIKNRLSSFDNKPLAFADDVAVGLDGIVYLTDASSKFNLANNSVDEPFILWDILEGRPNGRVIRYNPETDHASILVDRAFFPSGIATEGDIDSLLFIEITKNRLLRYWLYGPDKGTTEIVSSNFPGTPDDVFVDSEGHIWISLVAPRNEILDRWIQPFPWVKRLLARFPDSILQRMEVAGSGGSILRIDQQGNIVCQLLVSPALPVANVLVQDQRITMGVLAGKKPWFIDLPSDHMCLR